jgi:hypothetical protein
VNVGDLVSSLGVSVRVRSSVSPPMTLGIGGGGEDNGPPWWGALLKPQVEVLTMDGGVLAATAPYGQPDAPSTWLLVAALLLLGLGLVGFVGYGVGKALE